MRQKYYTESDALQALSQGREEALDYFFGQYYSLLTYFAFKLLGDQLQAEEITSEAFIKLWSYKEQLSSEGSIKAWLYRIVRNASIDHLRKVKRLEVHKNGLQYIHQGAETTVLQRMIESETLQQIIGSISLLPQKCGQVFQMYYLEGKSHEEIAKELNISQNTVRNHKAKALQMLRARLPFIFMLLYFLFP